MKDCSNVTSVVWFKRDLRIFDHEPLIQASKNNTPTIPLYIIEPEYWRLEDVSRRHWHFIHDSLLELRVALAEIGAPLLVRVGDVISVLENLRQEVGKLQIFSHQETGNAWTYSRDKQVLAWCKSNQINWQEFASGGVVRALKNRDNWSALRKAKMLAPIIAAPQKIMPFKNLSLGEIPSKNDQLFGESLVRNVQQGGRINGLKVLNSFLNERAAKYIATLSKPGVSARNCSRLSAHIAYGTLSIREIEQATLARINQLSQNKNNPSDASFKRNLSGFLARLVWRCHFVQKLEQQSEIEFKCMHQAFEGIREQHNEIYFTAWKEGKTGYPLIDACMRSLHQNGWITFRMRAMLVSFASYNLWLDWRKTAPFLARLFTDYEPGIHYSQFQMQSGVTGINAIRIYNPVKQSIDHDLEGKFIKRFVPELKDVSMQFIHQPWKMEVPPQNYPEPIVDFEIAAKNARKQIKEKWRTAGFKENSQIVLKKLASRKRSHPRKIKKEESSKQLELF